MSLQYNYLALDIGQSRIGLAVGSIIALGRGAIDATRQEQALTVLQNLINEEGITHLIVGLPQVKSGQPTESQRHIHGWIERLKKAFPLIPVITVNEAYTTRAAEQDLIQAGLDPRHHKNRVDERSAELILTQYLNEKL